MSCSSKHSFVCGLFFFFFIFKIIITYYYSDIHMMCIRLSICEHFRFPSTQGSLLLVSVFNYSQPAFVIFFPREEDGQISPTSVRCSCTSVLERVFSISCIYIYTVLSNNKQKIKPNCTLERLIVSVCNSHCGFPRVIFSKITSL